jgi:transcriptional adapter 2-alpha
MKHVTTPLFDENWGADEELVLLEAIQTHGLGNWGDAAKLLKTKQKHECEEHFLQVFLSEGGPVPLSQRPQGTQKVAASEKTEKKKVSRSRATRNKVKKEQSPKLALAPKLGYLPLRGEFIEPWDDQFELETVALMEFSATDTAWDKALKAEIISLYCRKLDAREARRLFILERGLLDQKAEEPPDEHVCLQLLCSYVSTLLFVSVIRHLCVV